MTVEQQQRLAWLSHDDRVLSKAEILEWAAFSHLLPKPEEDTCECITCRSFRQWMQQT